ncbi:MAG: hypothetical protein GYA21_12365 [Myxococcales bacterium]|nr:hypothetical protein [Myxococcales bacterium]
MMTPKPENQPLPEPTDDGEPVAPSFAWVGGICGLVVGTTLALVLAALLHRASASARLAEMAWNVGGPLLALGGLLGGSLLFQRLRPSPLQAALCFGIVIAGCLGLVFGLDLVPWVSEG